MRRGWHVRSRTNESRLPNRSCAIDVPFQSACRAGRPRRALRDLVRIQRMTPPVSANSAGSASNVVLRTVLIQPRHTASLVTLNLYGFELVHALQTAHFFQIFPVIPGAENIRLQVLGE